MLNNFISTILFSILLYSNLTFAGGPLVLEGATGNTPVTYDVTNDNPNITLNIENGDLGKLLSNSEADALVQQALDLWNDVSTSTINLVRDETMIDLDINETNFNDYLPHVDGTIFNAADNLNPVVYDGNGEIIDAYFGVGQSEFTIGFAASIFNVGTDNFNEGYIVINGKDLDLSTTTFKLLIAHEIGHFFGLDHSQADINNQESGLFFCKTSDQIEYPVMYPFACRDEDNLHEDDISSISALYPTATINNSFGILNGHLTDQSGNAILGANLWAQSITGKTYSIVSDYLKQGTGFYELLLPAGNYTLHVNSINTAFNSGSSIGPYSFTTDDLSFTCADGIAPTAYEGNTPGNAEVITISTNQTREINFSLSEINIDDCVSPTSTEPATDDSSGAISPAIFSLFLLLLTGRKLTTREHLIKSG